MCPTAGAFYTESRRQTVWNWICPCFLGWSSIKEEVYDRLVLLSARLYLRVHVFTVVVYHVYLKFIISRSNFIICGDKSVLWAGQSPWLRKRSPSITKLYTFQQFIHHSIFYKRYYRTVIRHTMPWQCQCQYTIYTNTGTQRTGVNIISYQTYETRTT